MYMHTWIQPLHTW